MIPYGTKEYFESELSRIRTHMRLVRLGASMILKDPNTTPETFSEIGSILSSVYSDYEYTVIQLKKVQDNADTENERSVEESAEI